MKIPSNAVVIDTGYHARKQFRPFHARRQRWAIMVTHPRAGKTVAAINDLLDDALACTKPEPRVAYVAPYFAQAKDVAWSYLKHFTSMIPGAQANEAELRVDLPNKGRVRLYGADNYDRMRGIYLDAVVLDEYADMDPNAWPEVIRPRLADRLGKATFIGTAHGRNHFAELWDEHCSDPEWFTMMLRASETGLLPDAELADSRKAMSAAQYAAEFECSFEATIVGAIYGAEMTAAETEGRVCAVPHMRELTVDTWWDLGVNDATAIWFTQTAGRELHVIDYAEHIGDGLPQIAAALQAKPYLYGTHTGPHDIKVRELGSGKSRIETAAGLGLSFAVAPGLPVQDGIEAGRSLLSRAWFDRDKTRRGRDALTNYRRQYDARRKVFSTTPLHDWASDGADAWRTLAVSYAPGRNTRPPRAAYKPALRSGGAHSWMQV